MISESEARGLHRRFLEKHTLDYAVFIDVISDLFERIKKKKTLSSAREYLLGTGQTFKPYRSGIYDISFIRRSSKTFYVGSVFMEKSSHPSIGIESIDGILLYELRIGADRGDRYYKVTPFMFVDGHAIRRFFLRSNLHVDPNGFGEEFLLSLRFPISFALFAAFTALPDLDVALIDAEFALPAPEANGVFKCFIRKMEYPRGNTYWLVDVRTFLDTDSDLEIANLSSERMVEVAKSSGAIDYETWLAAFTSVLQRSGRNDYVAGTALRVGSEIPKHLKVD